MDKKTLGIIGIVATTFLCGFPALFSLFMGVLFVIVGFIPDANIDIGGSSDPASAMLLGSGMLCVGVIGIVISLLVAFFTFKQAKKNKLDVLSDEPIPPAL